MSVFWWQQNPYRRHPQPLSTDVISPAYGDEHIWYSICRRLGDCLPDPNNEQHCVYCGTRITYQ